MIFNLVIFSLCVTAIADEFESMEETNTSQASDWEVTDLEIIESSDGVSLDLTYNETEIEDGAIISSPGCPKSIDGQPWVYYGNPPRCYLVGFKGPCPEKRILFLEKNSDFGICSCKCFQFVSSQQPPIESPDGRFKFCSDNKFEHQVHDEQENVCYGLETQGPCEVNQWLVRDKTGKSVTCVEQCPLPTVTGYQVKYDYITGECQEFKRRWQQWFLSPNLPSGCQNVPGMFFIYSAMLKRCVPTRPRQFLG